MINSENWVMLDRCICDIYEGLLEKMKIPKAEQGNIYPRSLIKAMVECIQLEPDTHR